MQLFVAVVALAILGIFTLQQVLRARARKRLRQINAQTRDKMVATAGMSNEFVAVEAANIGELNQEGLAQATSTLEQLGFRRVVDYRLRRDGGAPQGFERVLGHPEKKCFASVMATGELRPDQRFSVAINSYMESGWRLGTSNIPPRKADYYLRHPRILRMRYPDDSIEKLVERHLERRGEILRGLGISVAGDISSEFYFQRVQEAAEMRKGQVQKANPLGDLPLAEAQASARNQEWLGDYPAEAKRIREMEARRS